MGIPRRAICLLLLGLGFGVGGGRASAETFDYAVYLAGTRAGEARISVAQEGVRYTVEGVLRAVGWLDVLTAWRGRFQARGEIADGRPVLTDYAFQERDRRNAREVRIEGGVLTQTKNGRVRAPVAAPAETDLFSAFLLPTTGCLSRTTMHLGRTSYVLDLESAQPGELGSTSRSAYRGAALECRYRVRDEDKTLAATLWVAELGGRATPVSLEFEGAVSGGLYLLRA